MQSGYSSRKIFRLKIFKLLEFMDEWLIYYQKLKHKINPRLLPLGFNETTNLRIRLDLQYCSVVTICCIALYTVVVIN